MSPEATKKVMFSIKTDSPRGNKNNQMSNAKTMEQNG